MKNTISGIPKLCLAVQAILVLMGLCFSNAVFASSATDSEGQNNYEYWEKIGKRAATEAIQMIKEKGTSSATSKLIAMTNAGYAEVQGQSTMGVIDGIIEITECKRGNSTFSEIHSRYDDPLWCAIYDKASGYCAYLQVVTSNIPSPVELEKATLKAIFSISSVEQIDEEHLYANADTYDKKFKEKIFGGNEFRIVTIANAMAQGAPVSAIKAFEYHDHYCPGVTSGIMMVNYVKNHFSQKPGGKYFVQSVQPWCKEDALMTLLNATPGKRGYSVIYTTEEERKRWKKEYKDTATLIYREDKNTKRWEVVLLGFQWSDSVCKEFGKSIITKLCMDLWYLKKLDTPEAYIKEFGRFELPEGVSPIDWSRTGMDPMKELGLVDN
ncbi:conserved exported hypothetical protein [Desulfamplus magnetovallimortis]|uniref:Formylmethanofuran dehydrogenase subunit E domain-containing protein n=1 Tax=Desulfamplus magnetovallimortis TaxID=1246637 RepID=A0A1W1HHH9_9BACT|nr:FmdE family protein [Desulfamplus magnetovallimortis]SLM31900.1 conserved exported hypothetical protein [Desulfamplus magnetovallimortis]